MGSSGTTPAPVTPLALPVLLLRSTSSPTLALTRTWCWRPPRLTSMPPNQQPAERLARPPCAPPPPRRTSTPRLQTALTRTPSPAPPPPTSPPSAPTLAPVKDVSMLPVSSSETRDRRRSFQAWMFLVCNEEKSLPKSHRYYQ